MRLSSVFQEDRGLRDFSEAGTARSAASLSHLHHPGAVARYSSGGLPRRDARALGPRRAAALGWSRRRQSQRGLHSEGWARAGPSLTLFSRTTLAPSLQRGGCSLSPLGLQAAPLLCAFSSFQPWGVWASGPRSALQSVHVWMVFKRSLRQTPQWPLGARRHPTTGYRT